MWIPWRRPKSPQESERASTPEERVRRFQADYVRQFQAALPLHDAVRDRDRRAVFTEFFPQWQEMTQQVVERHFVAGTHNPLGNSFSSSSEYGAEAETYVRIEMRDGTAYVLFRQTGGAVNGFHEYVLRSEGGDFKIVTVVLHFSDPVLPFTSPEAIAEQQSGCREDAPLIALPEEEALQDENYNFTDREVQDKESGETSQAQVSAVGALVTSSGVLCAWDFGDDNNYVRPIARTVPPGSYPVDRVTAFGRNAALRVRFSGETPTSWYLANRVGSETDTVGVDAGCICIADYGAYAAMTPRDKDAAMAAFNTGSRPTAAPFSIGAGDIGIACDSGWGDGSYPVYWGLDNAGRVAQLVVDFSILVAEEDGKYRHL